MYFVFVPLFLFVSPYLTCLLRIDRLAFASIAFLLILSLSVYECSAVTTSVFTLRAYAAISVCTLNKLCFSDPFTSPLSHAAGLQLHADSSCLKKCASLPQTGCFQQQPAASSSASQIPRLAAHLIAASSGTPEGRF